MFGFKIVKESAYQALVDELTQAKLLLASHESKEADLRLALDDARKELELVKATPAKTARPDKKVVKAEGEVKNSPRKKVVKKDK